MTTKPWQPWSSTIVLTPWSRIDDDNSKEGNESVTNCNQLKMVSTKESVPQVLLIERGADPYKGCWAFPGGFMNMDETTEQCAIRELEEETGIKVSDLHQIGAYSKVDRDPRGRTITVAYLAIVDEPIAVTGQDDAAKAQWFPIDNLPPLAFDHEEIMQDAINFYGKIG